MTRSYTIPRNFWRVVRRIQRDGTYSLCQLSYDVGQRVSIGARSQASGFLFCMPYGRRPGGPTNERRFTLRCPAKSFTRIAPMCARSEERRVGKECKNGCGKGEGKKDAYELCVGVEYV